MKINEEPTISVLIPAFNAAATIKQALKSVLAQTLKPYEILVLDDGSTDNTADIVESFAPEAVLLREKNKGVSAARNTLLGYACGSLIALLDQDDIWHRRYLEIQCQMHHLYPDAVAYFTEMDHFEGDRYNPRDDCEVLDEETILIEALDLLAMNHRSAYLILPSFCVFRAEILRLLGDEPFPVNLPGVDDVYLWYRLALLGPFVKSRARLGGYRHHAKSLSNDRLLSGKERLKALRKILNLYENVASGAMVNLARKHLVGCHRTVAKYLMGMGEAPQARIEIREALKLSFDIKSLRFLAVTLLPRFLQPKYPERLRTK